MEKILFGQQWARSLFFIKEFKIEGVQGEIVGVLIAILFVLFVVVALGAKKRLMGKIMGMVEKDTQVRRNVEKSVQKLMQNVLVSMDLYREEFKNEPGSKSDPLWELSGDEISKLTEYMTDLPLINESLEKEAENLHAQITGISNSPVFRIKKKLAAMLKGRVVSETRVLGVVVPKYRGFNISNYNKIAPELPRVISVYNGIIAVNDEYIPDKAQNKQYQDVNKLEDWLFQQAREHGHGDLIDKIMEKRRQI